MTPTPSIQKTSCQNGNAFLQLECEVDFFCVPLYCVWTERWERGKMILMENRVCHMSPKHPTA